MSNDVFANTREISCKSGQGKSICCFPDVCMTPPENPAPERYSMKHFEPDCAE